MVMETPPNPQIVGREFVRQYYTLLNEAPAHLHRFYNHSSSFIHGGLDPPNRETTLVVGQKQIHQKIQQLNFRDCHAKISQVDSQETLGNGVVVQVTGELSNGGRPMRRFTQTFVLAFQAPKKYYVHNDIFRYQDMLTEEEYGEMSRNEVDENQVIQHQNTVHNKTTQAVEEERDDWSAQPMVNGTSDSHHHHEPTPAEIQPVTQTIHPVQPIHPSSPQPMIQPTPQPLHPQPMPVQPMIPTPAPPAPAPQPTVQPAQVQPIIPPPLEVNPIRTEIQQPEVTTPTSTHHQLPVVEQDDGLYSQPEPEPLPPSSQTSPGETGVTEVKTYANLVKGSSGNATSPSTTTYYTPPPPTSVSPTPGLGRVDRPKPPRESKAFGRSDENVNVTSTDSSSFDTDRGRKHYSDSQQLFMGNLPHSATENELKEIFSKFGNILDMRVLSKPGSKPGSRTPPNYGFIIFEHPSSVQAVLNAKPIIYPDESGTKLNVEEKKTKGSGSGGGGGPPSGRGGGRSSGRPSIGSGGPPRGPSRTGPPPSALPPRQNYHRR